MAGQISLAGLVSKAFAGSVTTQLIGAAAGILSARLLGPQGKGLLVIALLWPGLLGALGGGLGLEEAITYLTARTPERSGALMSSAAVLASGQALLLTTVGWLLLPPLLGNQVVRNPQPQRLDGRIHIGIAGQDDGRDVRVALAGFRDEGQSVADGPQAEVCER